MARRTPVCDPLVVLTVPGLDTAALQQVPALRSLAAEIIPLGPGVPGVGPVVRANLTTGVPPVEHGVVSHRGRPPFGCPLPRDTQAAVPRVWDQVRQTIPQVQCAVWNGDPPWCRTAACCAWLDWDAALAGGDPIGQVPLRMEHGGTHHTTAHMPIADVGWRQLLHELTDSAVDLAQRQRPELLVFHCAAPVHVMEQAGPASDVARTGWQAVDAALARLIEGLTRAYGGRLLWVAASEQVIVPVRTTLFPNRVLREAGYLVVEDAEQGPTARPRDSAAWAWTDSQLAHVYVRDPAPAAVRRVAALWERCAGIRQVLCGRQRGVYDLDHPHSGDVLLVAEDDVFLSGDYRIADEPPPPAALRFAPQRLLGYDPLPWWPPAARSEAAVAHRVHGACGAPPRHDWQRGVLLASEPGVLPGPLAADIDLAGLVLRQFGL